MADNNITERMDQMIQLLNIIAQQNGELLALTRDDIEDEKEEPVEEAEGKNGIQYKEKE